MGGLALALDRHHRQLRGAGITAWLGCLTAGAFLFIGLLPYAPRAAALLALIGGLAGLMAAGFARFTGLWISL